MQNDNYLSLINFKVKTLSSETFFINEHDVEGWNLLFFFNLNY